MSQQYPSQWQQQPPQQFQWQRQPPQSPQSPQPNTGYQQQSGSQWQQNPSQPLTPQQSPYPQQQPSQPLTPQQSLYPQQPLQQRSGVQWQQPSQPFYAQPGQYQKMLPTPPPQAPQPRKKSKRRIWIILGVIVLVFVIIGAANFGKATTGTTPQVTVGTTVQTTSSSQQSQPTATPTETKPTATPTPTFASFQDGTYQVGKDIQPGTYRTRQGSTGCYYQRLKGFSGSFDDIIANNNTDAPAIVTIAATDKGFESKNCGTWTKDLSQITTTKTSFDDGMYFVGTDITPGTYKNTGQSNCYYARLSSFSNSFSAIIANGNADNATIVTIAASDKGFEANNCGTWSKL